MQPLKILVFAEYGWRNGGENSWLAVARKLESDAIKFVGACPQQSEFSRFLSEIGVSNVSWNVRDDCNVRKTQIQIRTEIASLIRDENPDIVHANSLSTSRLVGPVTEDLDIPSVGYLRDIIKLSKQAVTDINKLSSIIAVSYATHDFHAGQGISRGKMQVIYNGVNLQQFSPSESTGFLHRELNIDPATRIILCVGQIGMRKGTDVVIKSFLELTERYSDIALVLIGIRNSEKDEAIEFERDCQRLCDSEKTANNVFWLGRRTDVAKIMKDSTLLLHGARQEPLGRVLLEALASGLPFVATDVGGTKEIVNGIEYGEVLCRPDSTYEMAKNAAKFLDSETFRKTTADKFREIATRHFDIGICAERLKQKYIELARN